MASKYMKKFSASLASKGTQIKTTMRNHFTSTRIAIIKVKEALVRIWKNWSPHALLMGL